jgi:ABC-type nickel/cobalt efflux system permease component RcnA
VAIGIVGVGTLLLNATAAGMAGMTDIVAIASYALIAAIGLMLLVARLRRAFGPLQVSSSGLYLCEEVAPNGLSGDGVGSWLKNGWRRLKTGLRHIHTASCGCVPVNLGAERGETLSWPRLLPLIASVGIRPCSGALIVLVFSLSGGLFPAGILSVLTMALGTGATIAVIALLSVIARGTLMRAASINSVLAARVSIGLQLVASALILIFGLTMMIGALAMHVAG